LEYVITVDIPEESMLSASRATSLKASLTGRPSAPSVANASATAMPVLNLVITDDLDGTQPGQLSYVNQSATMNGSPAGVSVSGSTITFNYAAVNGPLAPGEVVELRFRALLASGLTSGTVVRNTSVATWNNPPQTMAATTTVIVGATPGGNPGVPGAFAALSGSAWHDANFDDVRDSAERSLAGWSVELFRDNQLSQSVLTDANGDYRIINIEPNDQTGVVYELRFRAPGAGASTALLGRAVSPFTNGMQVISNIVVQTGPTFRA
jgi:hypothetical protein